MLFLISWTSSPEHRNAAIERFKRTAAAPPSGTGFHGRWHIIGDTAGVTVAETDDPQALEKWTLEWSDIFRFEVHPVMTDEQLAQALRGLDQRG